MALRGENGRINREARRSGEVVGPRGRLELAPRLAILALPLHCVTPCEPVRQRGGFSGPIPLEGGL